MTRVAVNPKVTMDPLQKPANLYRSLIIPVQDGIVALILESKDAGFCVCIGFHGAMPVEMIRGDIQNSGDIRRNGHLFQLKTGNFHDDQVVFSHLSTIGDQWIANIAANPDFVRGEANPSFAIRAYQRGGGGFPGRTGDTDHLAGNFFHKYLGIIRDPDPAAIGFN